MSNKKIIEMKRFGIIAILLAGLILTACNNKNSTRETSKDTTEVKTQVSGGDTTSVDALVQHYLDLKNSLANDNKDAAATAAKAISQDLDNLDKATLNPDHRKILDEVKADIREHAEHIAGNDIAHQREHFDLLSQDMIDLVKITGFAKTLYLDFCPMYNNKKGASWLSEAKEIRNPYYGKEMLECGELKEELKAN